VEATRVVAAAAEVSVTLSSDSQFTTPPAVTSADTLVTAVASTYHIFRIDCTSQSDIKFFIDGERVCASTTFNNAASGANLKVQPYFGVVKTSATSQATMLVDYVKIWQNRS